MMSHQIPPHSHHKRFYILMTTVIVGAILILLLMNDEGELSSLTGSSVGIIGEDGEKGEELRGEDKLKEISLAKGGKGEVEMALKFDTAPEVKEETEVNLVRLAFNDLSTKIKINEEELELKGLDEVNMEISGFKGEVEFDEIHISLKGEGDKVLVNGIEISTKGKMEISFNDLIYEKMEMEKVKIKVMSFDKGDGELKLGEKMNYWLEDEGVKLSNFRGNLGIGTDEESLVLVEGVIGGVTIKGEYELTLLS